MKLRTALLAICTGLTVWVGSALPAYSATRRIVLLFDERPELPGLALLQADLTRELTSNSPDRIEIYNEAMDLSRFGSNNYQPLFAISFRKNMPTKKLTSQLPSYHHRLTSC